MKTKLSIPLTLITVCLLQLSLPSSLMAQLVDTTGVAFGLRDAPVIQKIDSRSAAMGDATIADPYSNASMNLNPALLAFVSRDRTIQINSNQNWFNNIIYHGITLPVIRAGRHAFAFQPGLHHTSSAEINYLSDEQLNDPDVAIFQLDAGYAFSFSDLFSIGIFQNVSFSNNKFSNNWTYFADFGLVYNPIGPVSYAAVFKGVGKSVTYEFFDDSNTRLGSQQLGKILEIGASIQFPDETDHPYLSLSFSNEKRFEEDGVWYKAGAEFKPVRIVSVRSGIIFKPNDRIYIPRLGLGIQLSFLTIDYAASPRNLYGEYYHQVGLTINLF